MVVMTTEVLRNMLYTGSRTLEDLGFVVMDEVHYLADRFRGPVWEEVILHLSERVQLVSLSATVSNAEELGDWLTEVRGDTAVVVSEVRPVPLWQHVLTSDGLLDLYAGEVDPTAPGADPPINPDLLVSLRRAARTGPQPWREHRRGASAGRDRGDRGGRGGAAGPGPRRGLPRAAVVEVLDRRALLPAIFFVFSRAGCDAAVAQCLRSGLRLTTAEEQAAIHALVTERAAAIPPADLGVLGFWEWSQGLERGLAAHHAGLLPVFKETVEELFSRGLVKVVFATETLALGINMPARSVVLDTLTKWDGSAHNDLTPGEYTQLTGRAGRRGIDVEGHAVVVEHGRLDPGVLVGLASRRTYQLRSSFRPTYNMAVNLVAQVGRERAREILELSFAQFQADRSVVGLARQAATHAEALAGYQKAMSCHLGDFAEYAELRRRLTSREQDLHREAARRRQGAARAELAAARRGDVLEIDGGRRAGHAVVLDPGRDGFDGPEPTVLTGDGKVRVLQVRDMTRGVRTVARMRIPDRFNPRNPRSRADLASAVRSALADPRRRVERPAGRERGSAARDDATIADLRRQMKAHPCHGCSEREDHARWAERYHRLAQEHAALVRRIEGRTSSIARVFDTVCEVLTRAGYLRAGDDSELRVTAPGQTLRRLYAENDLLVAECLRQGAWDGLDAAQLAAVVAAVVFEARRDDGGVKPAGPRRPASGGRGGCDGAGVVALDRPRGRARADGDETAGPRAGRSGAPVGRRQGPRSGAERDRARCR